MKYTKAAVLAALFSAASGVRLTDYSLVQKDAASKMQEKLAILEDD